MIFRRIKSRGISHNSYFLANGGEAIVIDPRRDVDVYLELAREHGARIRTILETHRNEDYAIGSTALQAATDAEILHSGATEFAYGTAVGEGDTCGAGKLELRVLETPGHTLDSLTFVLRDRRSGPEPLMAFTGDTLFVGDTGRVDLLGPDMSGELANRLHASLFEQILPLGEGVLLCPAHGGGSVCGGAILDRDESSLGYELLTSSKLTRDREAFVEAKLREQHVKAPYFARMEEWNQQGNAPIHPRVPNPDPLRVGELAELLEDGVTLVDARMPQAFAGGHIPGSVNIWAKGLAAYMGWIVPVGGRYALILPEAEEVGSVMRTLLRIGYDECVGYLRGGFESWQDEGRPLGRHGTIDTRRLRERLGSGPDAPFILDVRKPDEWEQGAIDGAEHIFLGHLEDRLGDLPRDRDIVTVCSVGHRGGVAASLLAKHGFDRANNYLGGFTAWSQQS